MTPLEARIDSMSSSWAMGVILSSGVAMWNKTINRAGSLPLALPSVDLMALTQKLPDRANGGVYICVRLVRGEAGG